MKVQFSYVLLAGSIFGDRNHRVFTSSPFIHIPAYMVPLGVLKVLLLVFPSSKCSARAYVESLPD